MLRLAWLLSLCLLSGAVARPATAQDAYDPGDDEDGSFFEPEYNEDLATAQTPRDEARAHFRMGVQFYKDGDFRAALIEFKRAQEIAPHYKVLFNLGQAALELQDYVAALDYLNAYLAQGKDDVSAERRAEVDVMLAKLNTLIGELEIKVNEAGAEVFIDNSPAGVTPLIKPVRVSAGRIKVTAIKNGMQFYELHVDVAPGEHKEVSLTLVPIAGEPAQEPVAYEKTVEERGGGGVSSAVVMGIVTGAFAVSAGVMAAVTVKAQNQYNDTRLSSKPTSASRLSDLRNDTKVKAWITDGLLGATVVSAIVTTILALSGDGGSADESVGLSVSPDRLSLQGQF